MLRLVPWAFCMILIGSLNAQETLSPTTLPSWQATGAVSVIDPTQGTVALPSGGELTRTFDSTQIFVRLVSRPFFSESTAGMPSLEIGPASVTFEKDASGGALVLLGDKALPLPAAIPLDVDGRSVDPVDVTLGYSQSGNLATLQLGGQQFTLSATAPAGPLTVAVNAGNEQTWILNALELQTASVSASPALGSTVSQNSLSTAANLSPTVPSSTATASKQFENSRALFQAGDITDAEKLLFSSNLSLPGTSAGSLESGTKLIKMAVSMVNRHDRANARVVAKLAISTLQGAETQLLTAKTPMTASRAQCLIGSLCELVLQDDAAAAKAYAAALGDDPKSTAATNALNRLEPQRSK